MPPLPTHPPSPRDPLLHPALFLLIAPIFARAVSSTTLLPAWDADPLLSPVAPGAIGPAGSMLCDAISLLGAALLLARTAFRREPLHRPLTILTLIGAAAVALHAFVLSPVPGHHGTLGNARIGAAWLAAMLGALALFHAARDPQARRIAAGLLLGFVAMLALRGAEQVFFEHPATLRSFELNRAQSLAARGWTEGSPAALAFQRRLELPEATAWFGLSNVYGSFAASAVCAALPLIIAAFAARRRPLSAGALAFAGCAALALALSQSFGAVIATISGLGALAVLTWLALTRRPLPPRLARAIPILIGVGAILAPIALVAARGLAGEHGTSGLSLLFRWYYHLASARIFAGSPLLGVGPDAYQQAFLLAKPTLSPEEVTSPHCIPLDWLSTLGAPGLAWTFALAWYAVLAALRSSPSGGGGEALRAGGGDHPVRSTSSVSSPSHRVTPSPRHPLPRPTLRLLLLIPALATLTGLAIDSPAILPESAATRFLGTALWITSALTIAHVLTNDLWPRLALAAAAITLIAHAQIDVTASNPSSCALWSLMIAVAATHPHLGGTGVSPVRVTGSNVSSGTDVPSVPGQSHAPKARTGSTALSLAPSVITTLLILATLFSASRAFQREHHLHTAATPLRTVPDILERLAAAAPNLPTLATEATALVGRQVPPSPPAIATAIALYERATIPESIKHLQAAYALDPADRAPAREASRLLLRLADNYTAVEPRDPAAARTAADHAATVLGLDPASPDPAARASDWYWLATLLEHRADRFQIDADLHTALAGRLRVAELDPTNLQNALRLTRLAARTGADPTLVHAWATRTLALNTDTRLDPDIRGLPEKDHAEMQRLATPP